MLENFSINLIAFLHIQNVICRYIYKQKFASGNHTAQYR